jgi:hypothetical protein
MAQYLSTELGGSANQTSAPVGYKPKASVYGGRLKRLRASFTLATQTTSDTLLIGNLPAGAVFAYGVYNASVSLGGTATLAIGIVGTTGKYAAATAYTATAPTLFGTVATAAASDAGLAAEEQVIATIAGASLPASGTITIDLFYSAAN